MASGTPSNGNSFDSNAQGPSASSSLNERGGSQSSPARRPSGFINSFTKSFFSSSSRDRVEEKPTVIDLVTREGAIKKEAWTLMGKNNTTKTRLRTIANLQEVVKSRVLMGSTLEGIWHETQDMLNDVETRDTTIRLMIELTHSQHARLGLALRHTFFEKLREIGLEETTLKWLCVLSKDAKDVNGFEKDMDYLIADWMKIVMAEEDHPQALQVIQLAQQLIMHNSAFVCEESRITLVESSCNRCSRPMDPHTSPCLDLISAIMKYSDLPPSQLEFVVATLCRLVCDTTFRQQAWALASTLLNSLMGHRTRKVLLNMLENAGAAVDEQTDCEGKAGAANKSLVRHSLRGAVFFLSQSTWGVQKVDTVRTSPALVIGAFANVVKVDADICRDVLIGLRRLVSKYGRDLQHNEWRRIVPLLHHAHEFIRMDASYAKCREILIELLDEMEKLMASGGYAGNTEELYDLLESCMDCRKESSVLCVLNHRFGSITQLTPNWAHMMCTTFERFIGPTMDNSIRIQAVDRLQDFYRDGRMVAEHDIITQVVLPCLDRFIPEERVCEVQYRMLDLLLEVISSLSIRSGETSSLFDRALDSLRRVYTDGLHLCFLPILDNGVVVRPQQPTVVVQRAEQGGARVEGAQREGEGAAAEGEGGEEGRTDVEGVGTVGDQAGPTTRHVDCWGGLCMENMELVAKQIDQIVLEKWVMFPPGPFNFILHMLINHIRKQYELRQVSEPGGDVRVAALEALFHIRACPVTRRLIRQKDDESEPLASLFIRLKDPGGSGDFSWEDICDVSTIALLQDKYWSVTSTIITGLGRVLQCTEMVRTAGKARMERLTMALLKVTLRAENHEYVFKENEEESIKRHEGDALSERMKHLPIVLATLIGHTLEWDNRSHDLCRQIVEFVRQDSVEAVIAASVAVQRAPDVMASFSFLLLETLIALEPCPRRAVPVIELLTNASYIPQFYKLFHTNHFKLVADVLAPYSVVRYYNPFVVVATHHALMLWYARVPDQGKQEIRNHMEQRVHDAPMLYYPEAMSRQPSGDGRHDVGSLYQLGGAPDTPPPMGVGCGRRRVCDNVDELSEEMERALSAFFVLGRVEEPVEEPVSEKLVETSHEHFIMDDYVLTMRTFVEKMEGDDEAFAASSSLQQYAADCNTVATSPPRPTGFSDQRRRHQSAAHPSKQRVGADLIMDSGRRTMDDMEVSRRERASSSSRYVMPQLVYTKVIFRTLYGRRAFMMKGMELPHVDFEPVKCTSEQGMAFLQMVIAGSGARYVQRRDDDVIATRLRNLDRLPALELHVVGVLYKAPGQTKDEHMLANVYGSERYSRFIRTLGERRSLSSCPGGLLHGKHGTYTYEYQDELNKVVFQIATLMPKVEKDTHCNEKKKLIGNNVLTVVYNESGSPYKFSGTGFSQVAIEVTPVDAQAVVVHVHCKAEVGCWLALQKAVLSDAAASRLVLQLIIRAQLAVNVWRSLERPQREKPEQPYMGLAVERMRMMRALSRAVRPAHTP